MAASCGVAEQIAFSQIARLLEKVQDIKGKDGKGEVFKKFLHFWRTFSEKRTNVTDTSFFHAMRLLLPHLDKERLSYGMKETVLAKYYIDALGISKESSDAQRLLNYRNPTAGRQSAGDFAGVAYTVLQPRCPDQGSLTVAEINESLDTIAMANAEHRRDDIKKELQKLLRNMSALEQKWLIRIIVKDLKVGLSEKSIFALFHPDAHELYNVCSSLSKVCKDLNDPTVRMSDLEIEVFTPFRPMLGQRATLDQVEKLMDHQPFYIEAKIDGERMQLHKNGDEYKYFSRGSNDYTASFGATCYRGTITPFIHSSFKSDVTSCILDGEMIGYDNDTSLFISKGTNIDIKATEIKGGHPCFVVFDILLLNGEKLANKPLSERLKYLPRGEVLNALNSAIDLREEGIVVKKPDAVYKPSQRKGSGWLKIKPEYVDSLSDELDLLIVGGYYGSGRRGGVVSHFMLAVAQPPASPGEKPTIFHSFCKVGSGYTYKELNKLCQELNPHWKRFNVNAPPENVLLASGFKEKPDVWIDPENSKIVQVKAAEITPSERYKCGFTLRFPRVEMVRDDKHWYECLNADELETMRQSAEGKLTYRLADDGSVAGPESKKKRRVAPAVARTIGQQFKGADVSDVAEVSSMLKDKEFCILNGTPDNSKTDLERQVTKYGGSFVQNPSSNTFCVVAAKVNLRVKNIIRQQEHDIANADWLVRSLSAGTLLPFRPSDMIHASGKTEAEFASQFDCYGDSYTEDLSVEALKSIFSKIPKEKTKMSSADIDTVEREYFPNDVCCNVFRGCRVFPDVHSVFGKGDSEPINRQLELDVLELRLHGAVVEKEFTTNVTHVLVDERCQERVDEVLTNMHSLLVKPHVVTAKWINDSVVAGHRQLERNYRPMRSMKP